MDFESSPQISPKRAAALAALLVALVVYGGVAERLPGLPSGLDIAFHSLVAFPVFAAAIWLALPLPRARDVSLLLTPAVAGLLPAGLPPLHVHPAANLPQL